MNTNGAVEMTTAHKNKETSLREAIMNSLKKKFDCEGLEAARKWFDCCCANFSGEDSWALIYKEANNFIIESKRMLDKEEHQRQLDTALISVLSKAGNVGQQNFLFGSTSQTSYNSTKSNIKKCHKKI